MNQEDRTNQVGTTKETEQYVLNYSFDDIYKLLMVGLVAFNAETQTMDRVQIGADGGIRTGDSTQAVRIDDVSTPGMTYIGKAAIGSSDSASVWQIARLNTSSGLIKTWADADSEYDNIWSDRTTLTYS